MLCLSDVLLAHHELESFEGLVAVIAERARSERFLRMDLRPPFFDTPENWEDVLESTFTGVVPLEPPS